MSKHARLVRALRMRRSPERFAELQADQAEVEQREKFAGLRRALTAYGQNPEALSFLVSSGSLTQHDREKLEQSQRDGKTDFALCACAACVESGPFSGRRGSA